MPIDAEALFALHYRQLYRYLCRAVGHPESARDLTQELFLRVSRARVPDATPDGARAWVFRIARNLALDHHRRRQRSPELREVLPATLQRATQDTALAVNEALASLAPIDRDVFLLREVGGLGYEEIAQVCDLTPDAVRSRIHRARLQLRSLLAAPIGADRGVPVRRSGTR